MRGNFLEAQLDMGKIEAKQEGDYRKIEAGWGQGAGQQRQGAVCALLPLLARRAGQAGGRGQDQGAGAGEAEVPAG